MQLLTASGGARLEDLINLRVHLYLIHFFSDPFMSFVYSTNDPILECLAYNDVDDVSDVFPRHPVNLSLDHWKCPQRIWVPFSELQHFLYAEPLEIGYRDILCLRTVNLGSFICSQVFQVEYTDTVIAW